MNEPMTGPLLGLALSVVLGIGIVLSDSCYCRECGRRMLWRWRKRHVYDQRRYCAFHDEP